MFRKKIVTRFAPSPTGFLHVGGLRTALYNYLFAKKHKGKFLLRIEDTDQARKVDGAAESLQAVLAMFNLDPDNNQPIVQSTRLNLYRKAADTLINSGHAYYCFCTKDRLEQLKADQEKNHLPPRYDSHCKNLNPEQISQNLKAGMAHVIRFSVPQTGQTQFVDIIRGQISFENHLIDDQIIIKSDGFPTYHLASVVDDHDMKVTHVIRGEEWLSSTPKHIMLYNALGYKPPKFAHLPLLLNADKSKLSKRQGDVTAEEFLAKGYLPQALLNFILLLGWNPGTEKEIFTLSEMVKEFSLEKVNKAGAVFNVEKLDWLNGHYVRILPAEEITKLSIDHLVKAGLIKTTPRPEKYIDTQTQTEITFSNLIKIIVPHQEKLKKISDIAEEVSWAFKDLDYDPEILIWKKTSRPATAENLKKLNSELEKINPGDWNEKNIEKVIKDFISQNNFGNGDILFPARAALTGKKASPGPFAVANILGKEKSLTRIKKAIAQLEK